MNEHANDIAALLPPGAALIEFGSVEDAVAAYRSPAYQDALTVLGDAAVRDIRIIEASG